MLRKPIQESVSETHDPDETLVNHSSRVVIVTNMYTDSDMRTCTAAGDPHVRHDINRMITKSLSYTMHMGPQGDPK